MQRPVRPSDQARVPRHLDMGWSLKEAHGLDDDHGRYRVLDAGTWQEPLSRNTTPFSIGSCRSVFQYSSSKNPIRRVFRMKYLALPFAGPFAHPKVNLGPALARRDCSPRQTTTIARGNSRRKNLGRSSRCQLIAEGPVPTSA